MPKRTERKAEKTSAYPRNLPSPQSVDVSKLERTQSPNYVYVYANHANVSTTTIDVRLVFGQMMLLPHEGRIEDSASVTMTWEHAMKLRDLLTNVLEARAETVKRLSAAASN